MGTIHAEAPYGPGGCSGARAGAPTRTCAADHDPQRLPGVSSVLQPVCEELMACLHGAEGPGHPGRHAGSNLKLPQARGLHKATAQPAQPDPGESDG